MLKELKWSSILLSLAYIIAGVLLCMYPELSGNVICYMLGIAACVFGVINLVTYFMVDVRDSLFRNDLVIGLISLIAGILVITKQEIIIEMVPVLLGFLIVTSGFTKLQRAIVAIRIKYDKWGYYLICGVISIIIGVIIMFYMTGRQVQHVLYTTIGAGLIYCGVTDLCITLFLTNKFHKFFNEFENSPQAQIDAGQIVDAEIIHPAPAAENAEPAAVQPEPAPTEAAPEMPEFPDYPEEDGDAKETETPAADTQTAVQTAEEKTEEEPVPFRNDPLL